MSGYHGCRQAEETAILWLCKAYFGNYMSNLSQRSYLTTESPQKSVSESLQLHFNKIDAFVVTLCTDVQWFIDVILCSLLQAVVSPSQMFSGY